MLKVIIRGIQKNNINLQCMYQLDILRGIHADLSALAQEVNHLLGFQIVVHLVTSIINVIMFAYFFIAATIDGHFYWPYLVLCLLPAIKIFLIGHWGQTLEQHSPIVPEPRF